MSLQSAVDPANPRQVLPLGALNGQEHREGDGGSLGTVVYCLHIADTPDVARVGDFLFLWDLQEKRRADERTRTADLLITSVRSGVAGVCRGLQMPHI
jgi:hypothetical protein